MITNILVFVYWWLYGILGFMDLWFNCQITNQCLVLFYPVAGTYCTELFMYTIKYVYLVMSYSRISHWWKKIIIWSRTKIHTYVLHIQLLMRNQMTYDELHQTQGYWTILFFNSYNKYVDAHQIIYHMRFGIIDLILTWNALLKNTTTKESHQKPCRNQKWAMGKIHFLVLL